MLGAGLPAHRARFPDVFVPHHSPAEDSAVRVDAADPGRLQFRQPLFDAARRSPGPANHAREHVRSNSLPVKQKISVWSRLMRNAEDFDP